MRQLYKFWHYFWKINSIELTEYKIQKVHKIQFYIIFIDLFFLTELLH